MSHNDSTSYKAQEWIVLFDGRIKRSEKIIAHHPLINEKDEDAKNIQAK